MAAAPPAAATPTPAPPAPAHRRRAESPPGRRRRRQAPADPPGGEVRASVVSVGTRPPPARRVGRYCAVETPMPMAAASSIGRSKKGQFHRPHHPPWRGAEAGGHPRQPRIDRGEGAGERQQHIGQDEDEMQGDHRCHAPREADGEQSRLRPQQESRLRQQQRQRQQCQQPGPGRCAVARPRFQHGQGKQQRQGGGYRRRHQRVPRRQRQMRQLRRPGVGLQPRGQDVGEAPGAGHRPQQHRAQGDDGKQHPAGSSRPAARSRPAPPCRPLSAQRRPAQAASRSPPSHSAIAATATASSSSAPAEGGQQQGQIGIGGPAHQQGRERRRGSGAEDQRHLHRAHRIGEDRRTPAAGSAGRRRGTPP